MNKELKAFRKICKNLNSYEFTDEYKKNKKLIETALEDYELMKQTRIIVADKDISINYIAAEVLNHKPINDNLKCEVKLLFDEETQNKLKALDIIKEKRVDVCYFMNCKTLEEYNDDVLASYGYEENDAEQRMLTQEEYETLKEVLL